MRWTGRSQASRPSAYSRWGWLIPASPPQLTGKSAGITVATLGALGLVCCGSGLSDHVPIIVDVALFNALGAAGTRKLNKKTI